MEKIPIFYSPTEQKYYSESRYDCTNCHHNIDHVALLVLFWNKKESWMSLYCMACFNKIKGYGAIIEHRVIVLSHPPLDSIFVIIKPPELTDSHVSTFDMVYKNNDGVKIIDRTKHACRETIKGAQIGSRDVDRMIELDGTINPEQVKDYLANLKDAKLLPLFAGPKLLELK